MEIDKLERCEAGKIIVVYSSDLRTKEIETRHIPNPHAGRKHVFKAYRAACEPSDPVSLNTRKQKN